jgi:prophage tail gpP-like protein
VSDDKKLIIRVSGADYYGWETASVTRAIDQQASTFTVDVSNESKIDLKPGDEVQVLFGDELVMTGLVDVVSVSYSATSHILSLAGRSKTKDLIDSSAVITRQFKGQTIKQISEALVAPHGISVIVQGEKETIQDFQVEANGETVFAALQRLADMQQYTLTDDVEGNLVFARIGKIASGNLLKTGNAILSCDYSISEQGRYAAYIVKGQTKGNETDWGKQICQIYSTANDPGCRKNRVLIVNADTDMNAAQANKKAQWQQQANAGKSLELKYTVQGWTGSAGQLWRENTLVQVEDSILGFTGTLVISAINYNLSASGTTCDMTLNHPSAYEKESSNAPEKKYTATDKPGKTSELATKIDGTI